MKELKMSHVGFPVAAKRDSMTYREGLGLWATNPSESPFSIEYMFFDPDTPMPACVRENPHIAYTTDDFEGIENQIGEVVYGPETRPNGRIIIFSVLDGLLIEVMCDPK